MKQADKRSGFTLVEIMLVTSIALSAIAALAIGIDSGFAESRQIEERRAVLSASGDLLDRLFRIEFGQIDDPDATAAQLDELFDTDDDLSDVTLHSLTVDPGTDGFLFQFADDPTLDGLWEVKVSADIDADGIVVGAVETGGRLLRIDIAYEGTPTLETLRSWVSGS